MQNQGTLVACDQDDDAPAHVCSENLERLGRDNRATVQQRLDESEPQPANRRSVHSIEFCSMRRAATPA